MSNATHARADDGSLPPSIPGQSVAPGSTNWSVPGDAIDQFADGYFEMDRGFRYRRINAAAARLVQMSPEAILGQHVLDLFPEVDTTEVHQAVKRVMAGGCPEHIETYYAPLLFRPHLFFRGGRLLFGDQVIFCRREQFAAVGGYNGDLPIMEEADLLIKLVRFGRVRQVNRVVESSDRRVAAWGFWKANGIYLAIGILWGVGYSPEKLKRWFADIR